MILDKIPAALKERRQWCLWKTVEKNGRATKLPFAPGGEPAKSNDQATWVPFDDAVANYQAGGYDGIGFVFSADDPFCGIDLDGCRNPDTGEIAPWAREALAAFKSYSEVSPSLTGVKVFVRAKNPLDCGKKRALALAPLGDKAPAVEVYDSLRYFAVTGMRLGGLSNEIEPRQNELAAFCVKHWPPENISEGGRDWYGDDAVMDRARKYVATMPPAIDGQGGSNVAFRVACVLVLGFSLRIDQAFAVMSEWNQICQPPWSDKELRHKLDGAAKKGGSRGYLRNATQDRWQAIEVPDYREPEKAREARVTTLKDAAYKYLDGLHADRKLLSLGIPDLDYALGGGVDLGEMVLIAARPGQGKSCWGLQCVHHLSAIGLPCVIISQEMSALSLGKRTIQWASDTAEEHWRQQSIAVTRHLDEHFADRAPCWIVEDCGTVERAVEAIERAVREQGVKVAVVDYAQLLMGKGKGRYEQTTNVSIVLRNCANRTGVLMLVLCAQRREESANRRKNRAYDAPSMSAIKESGELEQDADVILFLSWPHRIDSKNPANEMLGFIVKNRHRPINTAAVKFRFEPSRQMIIPQRAAWEQGIECEPF